METLTYKTVGDCAIKLDIYPVERRDPAPVVIWLHGGGLIFGSRRHTGLVRDLCTRNGFAVVSVDYRLAPETKLPDIIEDLQDAFRWVQDKGHRFNLNPERVGALGQSAGGYLALMAGWCVTPRPRAVVSFYGYGDIAGGWYSRPDPFYSTLPPVPREEAERAVEVAPVSESPLSSPSLQANPRSRYYLYTRQQGLWPQEVVGKNPHTDPDAFIPYCPIRHVDADYPPTLLLHGTADTDVPYQRSVDMALALERAGVVHEIITIPNGPHVFDLSLTPQDLADPELSPAARACTIAVDFLLKHV